MANSLGRSVSAQENNVNQEEIREGYECTICLNWLKEPVLTRCGHRFCKECIQSWLQRKGTNPHCPIDNQLLDGDRDIFEDNYTKRQIDQLPKPCENAGLGCTQLFKANDMDSHLLHCEFNKSNATPTVPKMNCTFQYCGCAWRGELKEDLDAHLKENLNQHLELMVTTFRDGQNLGGMENHRLWDAPRKSSSSSSSNGNSYEQADLIRGMYERIVILEQQHREQSVKLDKLTELVTRQSHGVLLWRVDQFHSKIDSMVNNPNVLMYSHEAYTSPHGYKFCVRLNISPKNPAYLALHFHMMQSENDSHLDWPFQGRIKIQLIHPRGMQDSQSDTIMSKPEILAFHRPEQSVSPRGFGFVEYAHVQDIVRKGFVDRDTVTIKIQVNLV